MRGERSNRWAGYAEAALAPHLAVTRHAGKLGFIVAIVVTLVFGLATYVPMCLATRRGRRQSFADAKGLVKDVAEVLQSTLDETGSGVGPGGGS